MKRKFLKNIKSKNKKEIFEDKNGNIFCCVNSVIPEEADIYDVARPFNEMEKHNILYPLMSLTIFKDLKYVEVELLSYDGMKEFLRAYEKGNLENVKNIKKAFELDSKVGEKITLPIQPTDSRFQRKMMELNS